jgi:hypothetical protein
MDDISLDISLLISILGIISPSILKYEFPKIFIFCAKDFLLLELIQAKISFTSKLSEFSIKKFVSCNL